MGSPSPGPAPGRVGPYRIERRLGAGGMGVVYLGYDDSGTAAAVKLIRPEHAAEPGFRARLRREVAAAQRVSRSCTAPVLAADLDAPAPWMATEYIDGPSLDVAMLEGGRLHGEELVRFAVGVAVALRAIHEQGIVHRDLKPSNILLSPFGPRVIDFGIAQVEGALTQLTHTGQVVGTPVYMAPEQLRGEPVSAAADVFAWAVVVSYAATGRPPFGIGDRAMPAILSGEPDLGELAEPLRGAVTAALHKQPRARPSAAELVDRLSDWAGAAATEVLATAAVPTTTAVAPAGPHRSPAQPAADMAGELSVHSQPTQAPPPGAWPYPSPPSRTRIRRWPVLTAVGAALVLVVATTATWQMLAPDETEQSDGGDGGSRAGGGDDGSRLTGSVVLDGSSSVSRLSDVAAELFREENSAVQVLVGVSGAGASFVSFCLGETDIASASRPIRHVEAAVCDENGIRYEQITIGYDGLVVVVNLDNPVDCLTVEQLARIWASDSTATSWDEIDGISFEEPLELFAPNADSVAFDYFTEAVVGESGAQRTDYVYVGADDDAGLAGVEGARGGIFYLSHSSYLEHQRRVKAVAIDGGDGCYPPSTEAVQAGSYAPLGRGLYLYPSNQALARPEVLAFVEFHIERNDDITTGAGAIPLTGTQRAEMLNAIERLLD